MTALTDLDVMLSVENRLCGILFHGKFCLGKDKVQRSHDLLIRGKLCGMNSSLAAQITQNDFNLLLLLQIQFF